MLIEGQYIRTHTKWVIEGSLTEGQYIRTHTRLSPKLAMEGSLTEA